MKRWRDRYRSSGLGLEIYLLAGLIAIAPIAIAGGLFFLQANHVFRERAEATLAETARIYGQRVRERLLTASEIIYQLGTNDTAQSAEFTELLLAVAVLNESGEVLNSDRTVPGSVLAAATQTTQTRLIIDASGDEPALWLARRAGERIAVGLVSSDYVWRTADYSDPISFCAVSSDIDRPLYCSANPGIDVLALLQTNDQSLGDISWRSAERSYLGAYAEIAGSPRMQSPRIKVIASMPTDVALIGLTRFQDRYRPTLYAVLILALLGAILYSKRILNPLSKMLDVTKELTKRDVWGRADVRLQDKYANLANHLQFMADDLAQQFNARETLSEIDQVILSGADTSLIVDLILRHIVESVQCRRAMVTILGDDTDRNAVTATMSRGHPVARRDQIEVSPESRKWLGDQGQGILLSNPLKDGHYDPFVAWDTPHTYILPILADGIVAAAVSIMTIDGLGLDEIQKGHVRDLAGRLAVALEAVSRSDRLRRKAFFDDLTGLPNRDFCFARLDRAIKQAQHLESAVAVMFIDLDGFKGINDSLGHIAGDELIRQAAYRLSSCVGESGTVGRLGGDEFAVVLPFPVNAADPDDLANRVLKTISEPFIIGTSEIHLSASIGVSRFPEDGEERSDLLRKADTAMYRAKESGRGRSIDYSDTMGVKVDERLRLESDLRNALDNEEFRVYYQPQIDMRTGRIVSAEALVRWLHPEKGLVPPNEFIPVAEEAGYIHVLGGWVMLNACKQLSRWQQQGLGLRRISVNVSARQFRHHDFINVVESCLLELLSSAESLEIELTESVFVDDLNKARQTLEQLKATGVYVSIDDFGTGYSSLGYLKHLTFDAVKVDQSFVHELPGDKKSEAIVRAVLAMCHTLDKEVVAEGIETDEQLQYLRKAGVDIGQGYRIGKPMDADRFTRYVIESERRANARLGQRSA